MVAMGAVLEPGSSTPATPPSALAAHVMTRLMKGSLAFAHAAWLIAAGAGFFIAGPKGALNSAVGGALVIAFFAVGQGVQLWASQMEGRVAMAVTLLSYIVRATILGVILMAALNSESIAAAFHAISFVMGVFVVLAGWLTGMFVTNARLRVPLYDTHFNPDERSEQTR